MSEAPVSGPMCLTAHAGALVGTTSCTHQSCYAISRTPFSVLREGLIGMGIALSRIGEQLRPVFGRLAESRPNGGRMVRNGS